MRLLTRIFLTIAFLMPITMLGQAAGNNVPAQESSNAVREADLQFARNTAERGLEGWMSFFADDAYLGTNPSIQGKLELRKFYQRLFTRRDLKFQWAPDHAEVFPSGNFGYTSGRYTMSFTSFQGTTVSQTGSYLTIWQKQPDGTWKVLSDYGSQNKAPMAEQKTSEEAKQPAAESRKE